MKTLQIEAHTNAKDKGFWKGEAANIPTKLMLIVSEISEALEAHRNNKFANTLYGIRALNLIIENENFIYSFEQKIKDTFEDELADAVIRILDLAEYYDINLEEHIKAKMRYNSMRPCMHGKKY